jgi:hypothetical protein
VLQRFAETVNTLCLETIKELADRLPLRNVIARLPLRNVIATIVDAQRTQRRAENFLLVVDRQKCLNFFAKKARMPDNYRAFAVRRASSEAASRAIIDLAGAQPERQRPNWPGKADDWQALLGPL